MAEQISRSRSRSRRMVQRGGPAVLLSETVIEPEPEPEPEPYTYDTYWATGDYGFERNGFFRLDPYTERTLPEHIDLPGGDPDHVGLTVDCQDPWSMVWTSVEARILINGEVWQDWYHYATFNSSGQQIGVGLSAETADSWPPPAGVATVQVRVVYGPNPTRPPLWDYFGWVHVRRYAITFSTLIPTP